MMETPGTSEPADRARRRWLLPAISAALLVVVLVLPDLGPPPDGPGVVTAYHGRIVALLDPRRPDPEGQAGGYLPDALVLILEGPQAGQEVEAYLQGPGGQADGTGYRANEDVVLTLTSGEDGSAFAAVQDRWRLPQLMVLLAIFGVGVLVAAGWRGLRALLALALTVALVVRVLIPLLVQGIDPLPVTVVLATAITILTIGLTEGFSRASVAAILGTAGALSFTALLAAVAIAATGFSNAVGEELILLETAPGMGLDLRGLLLAAFIFGTIGVLDDVTVTQATTVEELSRQSGLRGRRLYASAFNVGRSHIAATVNTLFLAYLGTSLPLLVLFVVSQQPLGLVLNGELVAIEIVRTLVGSLGIVAAVPFTTFIAVWLAQDGRAGGRASPWSELGPSRAPRPALALVVGLAAIAAVNAGTWWAVAPHAVSPPRTVLRPEAFGGTPPPSLAPSAAVGSLPPAQRAPRGDPPIVQVGASMPIVDGPEALAWITVLDHRFVENEEGSGILAVQIRVDAEQAFEVRADTWSANVLDGGAALARPATSLEALESGILAAGASTTGWLEFDLQGDGESIFLDYLGPDGSVAFIVVLF
jgi:uncharacterized membrane protein